MAGAGVTAGAVAYAAGYERTAFVLREVDVPVLPPGSPLIKVLHISDLHLLPRQAAKRRWLRSLSGAGPDLVVDTGDNLAHRDAVAPLMRALGDLLDLPGVFVLGSNDYYSPTPKNPARYLWSDTSVDRRRPKDLPWRELKHALSSAGWCDLTNATAELSVRGVRLAFSGVDDPHLEYDDLDAIVEPAAADLAIAVAHAPYLRVLDAFNVHGYRLILAGHTHGGQLCVPGYGALVTNCDLDRRRAKGLHRHRCAGHDPSWLHVSAGCGTSPYAPVRFACRPEATMLTLTPLDSQRPDAVG